ncbi:MAG: septum formation inhibitor Maf [Bryobacterales bacterium]|nr:septum formation inhibitor Maf [Bryobacterales bacterium]
MLILASSSPRRQEILRDAGIPFTVRKTNVEEVRMPGEPPGSYVVRLAREKAAAAMAADGEMVLAADTVVVMGDRVLEKPVSEEDAAGMLRLLSGQCHEVLTGVCLCAGGEERTAVAVTKVWFSRLTEEEVASYAASGEPMDKAGAYAIQGLASKFVERIEGCYFNVVGLPVSLVYRLVREAGGVGYAKSSA